MKNINPLFFPLFCITVLIHEVDCQICTKREMFLTKVKDFHTYVYWSNKECTWSDSDADCDKPVMKIGREPIIITKRIIQNVQYCCHGYVRNDSAVDNETIDCQPLCVSSCVNGRCDRPGQCSCYDGYKKDPRDQHKCIPICIKGCEHGICKQPNVCECNAGYQNINGTCSPVCTEFCHNGTCVAPDICDCLSGYRKSESNTCEPYCYSGCEHGSCVAPETCTCDDGWVLKEDSKCVPQYNYECLPGYELDDAGGCKAICKNCQGTCIGPYNCECDLPFVAVNYAADGTTCDCFTNCTDEDVECERTVCLDEITPMRTIIDDEATDTPAYTELTVVDVVLNINISLEQNQVNESRFQFNWTIITLLFGLCILLIILGYLVISKWKYLLIYFKGSSYVVEDTRDVYHSSQFVNVPLSDKTAKDDSGKSAI